MQDYSHCDLYKKIIDYENIYLSIYALKSYIFEKELLDKNDYGVFLELQDRFNFDLISEIIQKVKERLYEVLDLKNSKYFEVNIYLKLKSIQKLDDDSLDVKYRPLHTASLIDQIAMVCIFRSLLYEHDNGKIILNEFSKIFPSNFYGNIPSENINYLFKPWQRQYSKYSEKVIKSYDQYANTQEYKYEIEIDLKNFFPSVNPVFIENEIVDFFYPNSNDNKDKEFLRYAVQKLLKMKIKNNESINKITNDKFCIYEEENVYTRGIAQGLPQAYLFGNIAMLKISNIYKDVFEGKSFYYVDDSVIYTNKSQKYIEKELNFEEGSRLNEKLKKFNEEMNKNNSDKDKYKIEIHNYGDKTKYFSIDEKKLGSPKLSILGKLASQASFEIKNLFEDFEVSSLKNKYEKLENSIKEEINSVDEKMTSIGEDKVLEGKLKNYRKKLIRFKRFMEFRYYILKYNESDSSDEKINELKDKLEQIIEDKNRLVEFFKEFYDEGIFNIKINFLLRNNYNEESYKKIKNQIENFEKIILQKSKPMNLEKVECHNFMYFSKNLENLEVKHNISKYNFDYYKSLKKIMNMKLLHLKNKQSDLVKKNLINLNSKLDKEYILGYLKIPIIKGEKIYYSNILRNIDEIYRMILNVYISHLINVEVSDSFKIIKNNNRHITYTEYRLILYIRNKRFDFKEFKYFFNNMCGYIEKNKKNYYLDYKIFDVIDFFRTYIRSPKQIDNLIQIHKYTSEIWANGSKYLHFYTLHNEEHAMVLIRAIVEIIKKLDYFQIKSQDFYILFISCYLHDISMVLHPNLNMIFLNKLEHNANIIVTNFKENLEKIYMDNSYKNIDSSELKTLLISYYKKMDIFFENYIRNRHANDSAKYITNIDDLEFISNYEKDLISEICRAHGDSINDIYYVKSRAKDNILSKKFIKILLRIGDLLDVADNRVSDIIFKNNIEFMNDTTVFHWLSHQAISHYEIFTEYEDSNKIDKNKSHISNKAIDELITIKFYLNIRFFANRQSKGSCSKFKLIDYKRGEICLSQSEDNQICKEKCNFLCKWMVEKNRYLLEEFCALENYLKNKNNFFNTKIKIVFKTLDNARLLTNEEFEYINKKL
ncbi:MAG: hypothetical protein N4A54_01190 [Peptostreptococcaceae bacterium]|jgi:hypothetical protein|nr:hypothetical protein [Peptostreptococcaceae bacterium]